MSSRIKENLILAGIIAGSIIGLALVAKLSYLIWDAGITLAGFVLSILNFFLNILGLVLAVAGPVILAAIIAIVTMKIIKTVANEASALSEKSTEQFATLHQLIISRTSQWLPVLVGGVTQVILLTLTEKFAPGSLKVIASIGLWTIVSVFLFISNTKGSKKLIGWLLLVILCSVTITVVFWLSGQTDAATFLNQIKQYIQLSASASDLIGISFIAFCLIVLFMVAVITKSTANKAN